jgi:hypothetical protein
MVETSGKGPISWLHLRRILGLADPTFITTMTSATTREYKEKGNHDEIREEQHNTRTWKKDREILRRNVENATDEAHGWEEGEIVEKIM